MMERTRIAPPGVRAPDRPYSPGLKAGNLLFISGQVPAAVDGTVLAAGDAAGQTRAVFESIGRILEAAGGSFADIAEINYFLTDMSRFGEVDAARREFLKTQPYPASTAVEVSRLGHPDYLLEVSAIAVLEDPS